MHITDKGKRGQRVSIVYNKFPIMIGGLFAVANAEQTPIPILGPLSSISVVIYTLNKLD